MTRIEIVNKIYMFEKEKRFSEHIVEPNVDSFDKVSDTYDYERKGFLNQVGTFFAVGLFKVLGFFIAPYCRFKVVGKHNLKGVKRAVLTSNHINNIDCVLIKKAVGNKRLRITVGEFNNFKGIAGKILRAGGTLPFGSTIVTSKHISKAITNYLSKNSFVLFYPEGSLWWCYEKPRPLLDGAYYYATKNNVPIIPMFFTFKYIKRRKDGTYKKRFILNIGKPIYPQKWLTNKENIEYLKRENFNFNKNTYENFYNKSFEYID